MTSARARIGLFAAICLVAVAVGVGAIAVAARDRGLDVSNVTPVATADTLEGAGTAITEPGGTLVFRNQTPDDGYDRLAVASLDDPAGPRVVADLACERVHFRAGVGVCLQAARGVLTVTNDAVIFDDHLRELHTVELAGIPSRVKVSPDGTMAGATVFVQGHSYASSSFSTQTTLIDTRTGTIVADLERDFTVLREGESWSAVDFNFWGVTWVDATHFYATLGTGGATYLLHGDVAARTLTVVHDDVECPSLSPDGTRIAFKQRNDGSVVTWHIAVLDLRTMEVTRLAETRHVDDQIEWLDDDTVLYGLQSAESAAVTDTWMVPADGTGEPQLLVPQAWSTTVIAP
jgi:hypothetical protein